MKGVSVLFFLGLCCGWAQAIFLNHRPFPTYSLENMPQTSFSCRDKILGGYYADADTQCQMFHICVKVAGIGVQDFRFLCPNGTAFDQDHQICAEWEDIDCDATTLYYSSDNFDLYRLGSGFESKALKYGEDEEPFALQRAETGDARINREQQTRVVDQKKTPRNYNAPRQNYNSNNNDKEIFKGSSSSNFYNNRNNGKERDEDYDDNVNINQNQDYEQKRKVVRNKTRRPVQNNQNENNRNNNRNNDNNRNQQNNDYNRNQQNSDYNRNNNRNTDYNRNQNNDNNRNQNNDFNRNQNNDYNRNQNTDYNRNQNTDFNRNQNNDNNRNQNSDYNRNQNNDYNRNQNNDYSRNQNNDYTKTTQAPVAQTRRPAAKFTGFINNFAGSYEPTTSKPTSTTLNSEQYTTAINNYRNRNGQKQRQQNENTDSPVYTISTPAPFRQAQQQYNSPPTRNNNNNNGQYYSTTSAPQKSTENYPKKSTIDENYDIPKIKPSTTTTTQNYNTPYDVPKTKSVSTNNGQYSSQYESQKTTASQYETTKVKQTNQYPKSTLSDKTENYPSNNPKYSSNFDKKQTTPYKQNENYPTTLSPKPFSLNNNNNFPTTFAPRTNAAYSQIAQQTSTYNQNRNTQSNLSTAFSSTPRSTPFTQYTPTVPKLSSTTPVSRSSRFDETQYDDGSYSSKYDYDGDRREDEFLKTAHSQNIAASRNELSRTTKQQQTTQSQRTTYDVPRTYSTPKATKPTEPPKSSAQPEKKAPTNPPKKIKDVSYDYAYYDSSVGSEPDYEIDTEIKKSTVKN